MYILEGTIGAGKSTFLHLIHRHAPHIAIQLESVDKWQARPYGQSLLQRFYDDPTRWAYTFENFTLMNRFQEDKKKIQSASPLIVERSIYSGRYIFAQNSYENGFMTSSEWTAYTHWFDFLSSSCTKPKGFIYLKVDPYVAFDRIKKRNRSAESSLNFDYLVQINQKHEDLFSTENHVLSNIPVLVIDCSKEFEEDSTSFNMLLQQTLQFLRQ